MGPTSKWIKPAVFLLLNQLLEAMVEGLVCNYCYNANIKEDCRINSKICGPETVCYIETSYIKRRHGSASDRLKDLITYKMDCGHYSLCKDRVSHGPGPYGYAKIHIFCCCTDKCMESDHTSNEKMEHCPRLWANFTETSFSPSLRTNHPPSPYLLLPSAFTFFMRGLLST